jgi:glycosyltransferase involved in cell wall biosynthesis
MRQAWDKYHEYLRRENESYLLRKFIPYLMHKIRMWDRISADRVDYIICNSQNVARRIQKHYRRTSGIIHPPVNTSLYSISDTIDDYFLCVSRLVPYKRIDIAIEAFNRLRLPLKIIGEGNDYPNLKRMAKSNIEFLGWLSDREIANYYAHCRAFIFPGEEDFGITPLEAQAAGRPVIAYGKGGALETVVGMNLRNSPEGESPTGLFFMEPTPESLMEIVKSFNEDDFDPYKIREHTLRFDKEQFKKIIYDAIVEKYELYHQKSVSIPEPVNQT